MAVLRRLALIAGFLLCGFGWAEAQVSGPASVEISALPDPTSVEVTPEVMNTLTLPMTAADLADLADVWQGHTRSALERVAALNLTLNGIAPDAAPDVRKQLSEALNNQSRIEKTYASVLDAWALKGGSEEIEPHYQYLDALAVGVVRAADIRSLIALAVDWTLSPSGGIGILLKILLFLVILWVLRFIAHLATGYAERGLGKVRKISKLLRRFVVTSVYWLTFVTGAIIALGLIGMNITPIFAVLGGLSIILGFALQDTLGNFASGLMIMVMKPFDTGDFIEVSGIEGVVAEMSIVSTIIRTYDNQKIVVPNSKIWNDVITNVTAASQRRVDLVFRIDYSEEAYRAIEILKGLVAAHPKCLNHPEAKVFVGALDGGAVNIFCRPWCQTDDYWDVFWDLTGQAKEAFDGNGISMPFERRSVRLNDEAGAPFKNRDEAARTGEDPGKEGLVPK